MPNFTRSVLLGLALLLGSAPAALAGDPIYPLSKVREGQMCKGYSVIRGTDISEFDVEIQDVVEDDSRPNGSFLLVRVSGPAVDATGLGPGFSGSPIYCRDDDGVDKNAGAISNTVGEYGHKLALATPIEQILGESPDPPRNASRRPATLRAAKSLAGPLTVTGLGRRELATLQGAAKAAKRTVLAAPPAPLRSFPPQDLRPGSSVGVGLVSGDIAAGSVGTVAYRDGDAVWAYGHPVDQAGPRSLLLQDAYVYTVVNNPEADPGTYKLAAPGHVLGELRNDAPSAVVGRLGVSPGPIPMRVTGADLDTGRTGTLRLDFADETDVDAPLGATPLTLIGPLAIATGMERELRGSPARLSGSMCLRIKLRERAAPLRFCNTYVSAGTPDGDEVAGVPGRAAFDALEAFQAIEDFKFGQVHVTGVDAYTRIRRGLRQAFLVDASVPRRVRPGRTITVRLRVQRVRGPRQTIRVKVRVPSSTKPGLRTLSLTGTPDDDAVDLEQALSEEFDPGAGADAGDPGARDVEELAAQVAGIGRFDGLTARISGSGASSRTVFRSRDLRVSGRLRVPLRVVRRR